jgi:hypothetical protein
VYLPDSHDHASVYGNTVLAGALKGIDRSFEADCGDDGMLIEFRPVKGNALVSARSITPSDV